MNYVTSQWERDKGVILNVVRSFGPISRVEIHRLTQIRSSTISQITKELLNEGTLLDDGFSDNPTGRKQILLRINPTAGFILALEFDADEVTTAILDLVPEIQSLSKERTVLDGGIDGLVVQLKTCAYKALRAAGISIGQLRGIGIADVGPVNRRTGVSVMSSQMEFWREVKDSDDPEEIELYIEQFPKGVYVELARKKIAELGG